MNIVKQSLLLCIGALIALIGLQGAQSLWQVARVSAATDAVVAGGSLATASEALRNRFVATRDMFRTAVGFVDTESAAEHRKAFGERVEHLRAAAAQVRGDAGGETGALAGEVAKEVDVWTALSGAHLSTDGVTELPAYDRIDQASTRVQTSITRSCASRARRCRRPSRRATRRPGTRRCGRSPSSPSRRRRACSAR